MTSEDTTTKTTKVRRLVDVRIVAEPPQYAWRIAGFGRRATEEAYAAYERELKAWVKEFHEFMRDHRSQDPVSLIVERVEQDQCSACGHEWELMREEDGSAICASCGAHVAVGAEIAK